MDLDGENILRFDLSSPPSLSYLNGYGLKIKLIDTKMRDGVETAQSALHIFITCKNVKFNFNDPQPVLFFRILNVKCQNNIKYTLLRSLKIRDCVVDSATMFTSPCKANFTTVLDPLKLQILLKDQTATEVLFQSYAATTTIDCMT